MNKRFLTTGEIAKICEVSAKTVIAWTERNELRAFRIGRGPRRVTMDDFNSFLADRNFPIEARVQLERAKRVDAQLEVMA